MAPSFPMTIQDVRNTRNAGISELLLYALNRDPSLVLSPGPNALPGKPGPYHDIRGHTMISGDICIAGHALRYSFLSGLELLHSPYAVFL